jgi:hypothetical protein
MSFTIAEDCTTAAKELVDGALQALAADAEFGGDQYVLTRQEQ